METVIDVTPRRARRWPVWTGSLAAGGLGVLVASIVVSLGTRGPDEAEIRRLQVERNGYLAALCLAVPEGERGDAERVEQAATDLCRCVRRSSNPARDCNNPLRVWAVVRDAERCAGALLDEAPQYCACLEPIARLVTRASAMDVARRRAYGYDECRKQPDVPPFPTPAEPPRVGGGSEASAPARGS